MTTEYLYPKPGDLLLCYSPGFVRDGIVLSERVGMLRQAQTPPRGRPIYSHVAVYVGDGLTIEALGKGLVRCQLSSHRGLADIYGLDTLTHDQRDTIIHTANQMYRQGYTYDYYDIAVQLFRLTLDLKLPWHQTKSVICSVFGYDVYSDVLKIAKQRNCDPEDIAVYGALPFKGRWL